MAKNGFTTVISVQPEDSVICFYSIVGTDAKTAKYQVKNYKSRFFDDEFFSEFARCLSAYAKDNPSYARKSAFVTVLLPNTLIASTSINIPGVGKKSASDLFKVAVEGTYANLKELKLNQLLVKQNKQYSTVAMTLIRQKLVQSIYTACSGCSMFANVLTTRASGTVSGAVALNSKLKNDPFILVDIKEASSVICYATKGLMLGCLDLPFGWSILNNQKPVAENMLFQHDVAELAVLNAKEKAKAKQLTMMGGGEENQEEGEGGENSDEEDTFGSSVPAAERQMAAMKTLPKKQPRILPKWMQRPIPETQEGVAYENFRIFVKYVLEFIRANHRLTAIAQPTVAYINMPKEFGYLINKTNEEEKENKIKFASLGLEKEKEIITKHLELYGGLYASDYGTLNNF